MTALLIWLVRSERSLQKPLRKYSTPTLASFVVLTLPTIGLLRHSRLGELCDFVTDLVKHDKLGGGGIVASEYKPLVCLNEAGKKPPLFLIQPGVDEILVFLRLANVLNDDRPVYAIRARGFDRGEIPFKSIIEMSNAYVPEIERLYPSGPYNIAGYSFGAAVAFKMGKELEAKGKKVSFFGALNLPPHIKWRCVSLFEVHSRELTSVVA
jgi:hypothetical protein